MADFESILKEYTSGDDGTRIPGVVFLAANSQGELIVDCAAGVDSVRREPERPFTKDTVADVYSMTKLLTAISVMQCVERGLLNLDRDISVDFPEWKTAQVLEGWNGDEPILRPAKGVVTPRILLTHRSGLGYEFTSKDVAKWMRLTAMDPNKARQIVLPLLFDPGKGWAYGSGSDWAGIVLEKATGMRLNDWMKANIFEPLGMVATTFRYEEVEGFGKPIADMAFRGGGFLHSEPIAFLKRSPDFDQGGGGLYSTASDYIKVLISILRNDGRLLKPESVDALFEPQLDDASALVTMMTRVRVGTKSKRIPPGKKLSYGLGGMLNLDPFPGRRARNTLEWSGLPNLFWWIDRESGVCACMFEQLLPSGDPSSTDLCTEFEKHVYKQLRGDQGGDDDSDDIPVKKDYVSWMAQWW